MRDFDAVVFDMDGVIFDSEKAVMRTSVRTAIMKNPQSSIKTQN